MTKVHSARSIAGTLTPADMTDDAYGTARAFSDLASIDAKAGNTLAVRVWAQRLKVLEDKGKEELARVYYLGTTLGDESAFDGLRDLLGEEHEAEKAKRDQARAEGRHYYYPTLMNRLADVVVECAERGGSIIEDFLLSFYVLSLSLTK